MDDPTFDSSALNDYVNRWQAGDLGAVNELFRITLGRLEKLARKMSHSFPNVRGLADSDDVLQDSLLRLLRSLQRLRPPRLRDFFNLAAVQIRRELLDLARRGRHRHTVQLRTADSSYPHTSEPAAPDDQDPDAERWVRFHEAVDRLPTQEREVVGLVFYHGWTQEQIAELFGVDERTIRRRWARACERLRESVGELPEA